MASRPIIPRFAPLEMSGYGAGIKNIDVGIGNLWVAYLGGLHDDISSPDTGSFYKHSLDVQLKDVAVGPGKFMFFGVANYEKGTTFKNDFNGNPLTVTNPVTGVTHNVGVRTSDAWGLGGGASYRIDLDSFGPKSFVLFYTLFGFGATNFTTGTDLGTITGFESAFLAKNPGFTGTLIDAGNAIQHERRYRAGGWFIWNPNPRLTVANWEYWQQDSAGKGSAHETENRVR